MPFSPVTFTDGVTPLNKATFDALQAGVIAAERTENKAVANGYASLDGTGKVPVAQLPGATGAVPTFTFSATPPGSPAEGDLWYLPADATNGVVWMFRYRAASASAFKWEFVGGDPLFSEVAASQSTASTTYVSLATAGPTIAMPRSGDYLLRYGAVCAPQAAGAGLMSPLVNGIAGTPADGHCVQQGVVGSINVARERVFQNATVGSIIMQYRSTGPTVFWDVRWLTVTPIRVS